MLNSSKGIAIIGLGNTLRRDDGIGIHILSILEDQLKDKSVKFLNFGIASFGLINYITDFKKVLLIDAMDAGLEPASLKIFRPNEASYQIKDNKLSSHELSLSDLLGLCSSLSVSTDVHIASVQVKDTSYGIEMTKELEKSKGRIAEEIRSFLGTWGLK